MTSKISDQQGFYFSGQLQSEAQLESNLIQQLSSQGYERVSIETETDLLSNLKSQLEKHNKTVFSDKEFSKILNHL